MIFDTCFSGNTIRATENHKTANLSRYLSLQSKSVFKAEREIGSFEENLNPDDPYPYQNIFYISAASENEVAKDIQKDTLDLYPTIDGNPHYSPEVISHASLVKNPKPGNTFGHKTMILPLQKRH